MTPAESLSLVAEFCSFMKGDLVSGADLLKHAEDEISSIPGRLFYRNFKAFMDGISTQNTDRRKIGEKLAESDYGPDYGYALLKYIGDSESADKGTWLAYLIDAATKDFITPNEAMYYASLISRISLPALVFIRDNAEKIEIRDSGNTLVLNELAANNLVYDTNNNTVAFEYEAHMLNRYSLSYDKDPLPVIPELNRFPNKPEAIIDSQGSPYRGVKKEDTLVKDEILNIKTMKL